MEIRFTELFAGIGGFRYGLEKTNQENRQQIQSLPKRQKEIGNSGNEFLRDRGHNRCGGQSPQKYTCVWANEIDKYACEVYRKNFGKGELYEGSITKVKTENIPDFDLLTAGFPCQAFSIAGKRKGFEDTRGTLFFEIARICKAKRPRYILLENVKGLLSHDSGKTFQTILKVLSEIGYDLQWQVLNSKNFGVPQNRERVFIVGHLRGTGRPEIFPIRKKSEISAQAMKQNMNLLELTEKKAEAQRIYDIGGIARTIKNGGGQGAKTGLYKMSIKKVIPHRNQKTVYSPAGIAPTFRDGHGDGVRIKIRKIIDNKGKITQKQDGNSFALTGSGRNAGHNQGMFLEDKIRRLIPIECERLQGFPDDWTEGISDTQRYKCLGNAVTTNVITEIGKRLWTSLQRRSEAR